MPIYPSSGINQNDAIIGAGVSQGIGSSGVISQDIERTNIEQNKTLRDALETSRASMENLKNQRLEQARAAFQTNQANVENLLKVGAGGQGRGAGGGLGTGTPGFVLKVGEGYNSVLDNAPGSGSFFTGGGGAKYTLQGAGGQFQQFKTEDELNAYLQKNPEIAQATVGLAGDRLNQAGFNVNIPRISEAQSKSLLVGTEKPSINFGASISPETRQALEGVESTGKVDWTRLPFDAQAKLIDHGFDQVNQYANQIRNPNSVDDFNSMGETEQIISSIAGETDLARKSKMIQYAMSQGLLSPSGVTRRRGR